MQVSKVAMAVSLALVGFAAGAEAQIPAPPAVRIIGLSSEERAPIAALQMATGSPDRAAQDRALATARAAARTPQGRYAVGYFQLELGRMRADEAMQSQAVDLLVESGQATAEEMGPLLANQASRAMVAGDLRRTDRLLTQIVELQPANFAAMADQAELKARMGEGGNAVILLHRAVTGAQESGRPAPESWHLRGLALAFDARMAPQGVALARALVANYPSAVNWRDALLAYRELSAPDPVLALDIQRLMRVTQGLGGERDYFEHAEASRAQQQILEAKAVLDDGVQRGMVDMTRVPPPLAAATAARAIAAERARLPGLRTAALAAATGQPARIAGDAHFGQGQYAEAAEFYRAALLKGGEDANLVNSRLGAALAMAGRRPEAEAALRAVTGPRADLAGFWLAWLARRPA